MKKFIQLLLKKRFKILKNKKGFSLIEVLVAVAIIGIISAIAVPQFIAERDKAARVAADTSAGNIAKAFKNCVALGSFGACDTLGKIKVSCPAGATCTSGGTSPDFCADLKRGTSADGDDFNVCVTINATSGAEGKTYGGTLLGAKICKYDVTGCTSPNTAENTEYSVTPVQTCSQNTECTTGASHTCTTGTASYTYKCDQTDDGVCDTSAGTCS